MATPYRGFQLGLLPERKINKRASGHQLRFVDAGGAAAYQSESAAAGKTAADAISRNGPDSDAGAAAGAGSDQAQVANQGETPISGGEVASVRAAQAGGAARSAASSAAAGGGAESCGEPVRCAADQGRGRGAPTTGAYGRLWWKLTDANRKRAGRTRVQTGGFEKADPNGLPGTGKQGAKLYTASALGSAFDMPAGPGQGNGSGGSKGIKGTVASADFGSGIATGGKGDGRGNGKGVAPGGFGSEQVVHQGPKIAQADSSAPTTPVEITYKAESHGLYHDENAQLEARGRVLLEGELFS